MKETTFVTSYLHTCIAQNLFEKGVYSKMTEIVTMMSKFLLLEQVKKKEKKIVYNLNDWLYHLDYAATCVPNYWPSRGLLLEGWMDCVSELITVPT